MNRRRFIQQTTFAASAILLPQQQWMSKILFSSGAMTPLRRNIGFYTERGGTIGWLLNDEHAVVVDTQFQEQSQNLVTLMTQSKPEVWQNTKPLDVLINTHHHGDHTSGNIVFKDLLNTHVAHNNSKINQERAAQEREKMDTTLLPTTTFTDQWTQRVGDETITMHHFGAAHTNGDAFVHFEEANVVHAGDLVFNRRFPYIDKSAGADIQNWIKVLKQGRRTFDKETIYIFGHSDNGYPVTGTAADLKAMENYLCRLLQFMKKAIRQGRTLEDIKATTTEIPKALQWQGNEKGIARSLDAAWAELKV